MKELEVQWSHVLQVWWAFAWRGFVYAMLPCFVLGLMAGVFFAVRKIPIEPHMWKLQLLGFAIGLGMGIYVIRIVLTKTFSGFRIALIAVPPPGTVRPPPLPGTAGSDRISA